MEGELSIRVKVVIIVCIHVQHLIANNKSAKKHHTGAFSFFLT